MKKRSTILILFAIVFVVYLLLSERVSKSSILAQGLSTEFLRCPFDNSLNCYNSDGSTLVFSEGDRNPVFDSGQSGTSYYSGNTVYDFWTDARSTSGMTTVRWEDNSGVVPSTSLINLSDLFSSTRGIAVVADSNTLSPNGVVLARAEDNNTYEHALFVHPWRGVAPVTPDWFMQGSFTVTVPPVDFTGQAFYFESRVGFSNWTGTIDPSWNGTKFILGLKDDASDTTFTTLVSVSDLSYDGNMQTMKIDLTDIFNQARANNKNMISLVLRIEANQNFVGDRMLWVNPAINSYLRNADGTLLPRKRPLSYSTSLFPTIFGTKGSVSFWVRSHFDITPVSNGNNIIFQMVGVDVAGNADLTNRLLLLVRDGNILEYSGYCQPAVSSGQPTLTPLPGGSTCEGVSLTSLNSTEPNVHYPWKKGEWHQIAITWSDTMGMNLYVDGGLMARNSSLNRRFTQMPNRFYLGSRYTGDYPFNGDFDDIRFFNQTLTDWDVQLLFKQDYYKADRAAKGTATISSFVSSGSSDAASCYIDAYPSPCVIVSPATTCESTVYWVTNKANTAIYANGIPFTGTSDPAGVHTGKATWITQNTVVFEGKVNGTTLCSKTVSGVLSGTPTPTPKSNPPKEILSNSSGLLTLSYTVGNGELIRAGGGFKILIKHGTGNLAISEIRSTSQVTLVTIPSNKSNPVLSSLDCHGGVRLGADCTVSLLAGILFPGDKIYFTLDTKFNRTASLSDPNAVFNVAVDQGGEVGGFFYELPLSSQPKVRLTANNATNFLVTTPSNVGLADSFSAVVVALDDGGNPSPSFSSNVKIYFDDENDEGKKVAEGALMNGYARFVLPSFSSKGVTGVGPHVLKVKTTTSLPPTRSSNVIYIYGSSPTPTPEYKLYWGDIHIHTTLSDGAISPEKRYQYARDISNFDFAALGDHSGNAGAAYNSTDFGNEFDLNDWSTDVNQANLFNKPNDSTKKFVAFPGYEYNQGSQKDIIACPFNTPLPSNPVCLEDDYYCPAVDGDWNVYFNSDNPPFWQPNRFSDLVDNALDWTNNQTNDNSNKVFIVPHHGGRLGNLYLFGNSVVNDRTLPVPSIAPAVTAKGRVIKNFVPSLIPAVEITSEHVTPPCNFERWAQRPLKNNVPVGFIASSDNHAGRPWSEKGGYIGVWAKSLTRDGIFEAIKARRTIGTSSLNRPYLETKLTDGNKIWLMGEDISLVSNPTLTINVGVFGGVQKVELFQVKNDGSVISDTFSGSDQDFTSLTYTGSGNVKFTIPSKIYVKLTQNDGGLVWSSPMFINEVILPTSTPSPTLIPTATPTASPTPINFVTVSGRVINSSIGEGISGVRINEGQVDGCYIGEAMTDSNGHFYFYNVPRGRSFCLRLPAKVGFYGPFLPQQPNRPNEPYSGPFKSYPRTSYEWQTAGVDKSTGGDGSGFTPGLDLARDDTYEFIYTPNAVTLSGRVVKRIAGSPPTDVPIAGVVINDGVDVSQTGGKECLIGKATTDSDGRFRFENITAGQMFCMRLKPQSGLIGPNTSYEWQMAGYYHAIPDVEDDLRPRNDLNFDNAYNFVYIPSGTASMGLSFSAQLGGITSANVTRTLEFIARAGIVGHTYTVIATSSAGGVFFVPAFSLDDQVPGTYSIFLKDKPTTNSIANHLQKRLGDVTLGFGANSAPSTWGTDSNYTLVQGDVNGDNVVNIEDVKAILSVFTSFSSAITPETQVYDINGDALITAEDVALILSAYSLNDVEGDNPDPPTGQYY